MIKVGDEVRIVISKQLMDMGMLPFVNRWGKILEIKSRNIHTPGVWLEILNDFDEPEEWFVPMQSIRTKEYDLQKKNLKILKDISMK